VREESGIEAREYGAAANMAGSFGVLDMSSDQAFEASLATAVRMLDFKEQVIKAVLSRAGSAAVVDFSGRPHITKRAILSMLGLLGHWYPEWVTEPRVTHEDGRKLARAKVLLHHSVLGTVEASASARRDEKRFEGMASDTTSNGYSKDPSGEGEIEMAMEDMAAARAIRRAGEMLLSLGHFDWEDLEALGFQQGRGGGWTANRERKRQDKSSGKGSSSGRKPSNKGSGSSGDSERDKLKRQLMAATNKRKPKVSLGQCSEWAAKNYDYQGDKIFEAPIETLRSVVKDVDAGKLDQAGEGDEA
jgi:hypothetical protein